VYLSTDYVFDGLSGPYSESDRPGPINTYGKHKLMAERIILDSAPDSLIVRTSVVYGGRVKSLGAAGRLLCHLASGLQLSLAANQFNSPTLVSDIVVGIQALVQSSKSGIYNISGPSTHSRVEFARSVADVFALDSRLIRTVNDFVQPGRAPRPLRCGLRIDKAAREIDFAPSSIACGLLQFCQEATS